MDTFKRLLLFFFGGALAGVVVASVTTPAYLAWDSTPRNGQALCNCVEVVRETTRSLIHGQLIGALVGGVALLILGIVLQVYRGKRRAPSGPAKASGPSSAA